MVNRGLDMNGRGRRPRRGLRYLRAAHMDANVPVTWLESSDPSYILHLRQFTSVSPRGVQSKIPAVTPWRWRPDEAHIYCGKCGRNLLSTSDIGLVVACYIIYAHPPQIPTAYEGIAAAPGRRHLVEDLPEQEVTVITSRPPSGVPKKQDPAFLLYDLPSCAPCIAPAS